MVMTFNLTILFKCSDVPEIGSVNKVTKMFMGFQVIDFIKGYSEKGQTTIATIEK